MISLCGVGTAEAVPNPGAINWTASPDGFVRSLYVGVLGRRIPASDDISGWSNQVTGNSNSRLKVFWGFINSAEYQQSSWARQRREYYLYQRYNIRGNTYTYSVSKGVLGADWRTVYGPTTFGIATALRGYYSSYVRSR